MNRLPEKLWLFGWAILGAALLAVPSSAAEDPAFQGFGASTKGGNEGPVVAVTTLADSGAGSLREALKDGNRRIVFKVGGTIKLKSDLHVKSKVTIDGRNAPDAGITIAGHSLLLMDANDVIVRNLRIRGGTNSNMRLMGAVRNVVIDHCSFSKGWDRDLIINVNYKQLDKRPRDITVSWCIFADVNKGILLHGVNNLSIHHCLFTNCHQRNPQFHDVISFDYRNNFVRNWGSYGARARAGSTGNVINNVFGSDKHPEQKARDALVLYTKGPVFVSGCIGPDKVDPNKLSQTDRPLDAPKVDTVPAAKVIETVLKGVGAQPLDEIDRKYLQDNPGLKPAMIPRPGKIKD